MRPIKLKMSAFGSYVGVEVIDFTKLYDKGIFLITGPTGAGKTTIFDGICYALYGRSSSSDKDENFIRNDMAGEDTLTFVELEFELGNKKYQIKRSPRQIRRKLRGDGYTDKPAEAELKLYDEDRLLTSITDVNDKIVELIGLEYDQFRQIIMIPQGEFRQLITAKSREREEILRRIFGTTEYRKVQEALDKMAKNLKADIERLNERWKTNISSINAGGNQDLATLKAKERVNLDDIDNFLKAQINADQGVIIDYDRNLEIIEKEIGKIHRDINEGKHVNSLLERKAQIQNEKKELEDKKPTVVELERSVEKGRKALAITAIEQNYLDAIKKYKIKRVELENTQKEWEGARERLHLAEKEFENISKRSSEADNLKQDIGRYKGFLNKVKDYDTKRKVKTRLEKSFIDSKKQLDKTVNELKSIDEKIKQLTAKREGLKNAESNHTRLKVVLNNHNNLYNRLVEIKPLVDELEDIFVKHKAASHEYDQLLEKRDALKLEVDNIRKKFIEGYAGKLSQELKDGDPCPVCGSLHHPNPARHVDGIPTEDDVTAMEAKLEKQDKTLKTSQEKRDGLLNSYQNKKFEMDAKKKIIEELLLEVEYMDEAAAAMDTTGFLWGGITASISAITMAIEDFKELEGKALVEFVNSYAAYVKSQINTLEKDLVRLSQAIEEEKRIGAELTDLTAKKETNEGIRESLNKTYTTSYAYLESAKKLIEELEKELPEDIRSEAGLNERLKKLSNEVKAIEDAIKAAQEKHQKCSQEYTSLSKEKEERNKALEEQKQECIRAHSKYEDQLSLQGFKDKEEYKACKLSSDEIDSRDKEIKKFYEDLKSANDRYDQIVEQTKDLSPVDIKALEEKLKTQEENRQTLNDQKTTVFSRLENNKRIYEDLLNIYKDINEKESEYKVVGELYNVANGRNNYKVTFETYVLAAYFEQIIAAANVRLRKMTKNRFQMERIQEEGSGHGYRGLDINILDANSGQYRPIKNISGGESFKASLSLALGLADVVQSHAGGIKLDTMFIDEGFGSLDTESLDDAINCLLDLQESGRLVGIISHVAELKERIHCRIEVEPTVNGSKTKCIV